MLIIFLLGTELQSVYVQARIIERSIDPHIWGNQRTAAFRLKLAPILRTQMELFNEGVVRNKIEDFITQIYRKQFSPDKIAECIEGNLKYILSNM